MDAEKTDDRRPPADACLDAEPAVADVTDACVRGAKPQPFLDEWIERGRLAAEGVLWRFRTGTDASAPRAPRPSPSLSTEEEGASEQAAVAPSDGADP